MTTAAASPDAPFSEAPHGKQSWYGPIGGIWQSVTLNLLPAVHITAVKLTPLPAENAIDIAATLNATLPAGGALSAQVLDPAGKIVAETALAADGCGRAVLNNPARWWSPDDPALYTVVTTLTQHANTQHATRNTCGFRTVEARAGRIYLNGQPIYLRGVLDQGYYPGTIYTPPSLEFLEDQARKAKALGLNCLRIHIKIEDPRYYDVADRFGLLVWTEIPNWVLLTPRRRPPHQGYFPHDGGARLEPPVDYHLDAGQRKLGHGSGAQPRTSPLAGRLLPRSEADRPDAADRRQLGVSGQFPCGRRHRGLSPLPRHPGSCRQLGRMDA
jgi:hypothetical protein